MIRLARHYIEEPPNEEPEHGWCPKCDRALVDAHECRCGWSEPPEADADTSRDAAGMK